MNLWSHRFSQNPNQKLQRFLAYLLINFQGRNLCNFWLGFWKTSYIHSEFNWPLESYNKSQKNSKYLYISFEGLHTLKSSSHHICFRGWQKTGQVLHGVSGHTFTIVGVHILTSWFLLMTCVSVVHFSRPKVSQKY